MEQLSGDVLITKYVTKAEIKKTLSLVDCHSKNVKWHINGNFGLMSDVSVSVKGVAQMG